MRRNRKNSLESVVMTGLRRMCGDSSILPGFGLVLKMRRRWFMNELYAKEKILESVVA